MNNCPSCNQLIPEKQQPLVEISVVLPVFNEQETIKELYRRLTKTLQKISNSYELIFIDDGSKDLSFNLLEELTREDPKHMNVIKFSRNFGHHVAITAGIEHSRGKYTVLMDSDLQNPPEEIPLLYKKIKEGHDCVYGIRSRKTHTIFKNSASFLFNKLMNKIVKPTVPINSSIFRIMNRDFVLNFKKLPERERFISGLMSWMGFKQTGITVKQDPRFAGNTKYSLGKMFKLAMDSLSSFSYLPLQLSSYIGFFIAFFSFLVIIFLFIKYMIFGFPVSGWPSLMVTILFLSGIQLIALGLIGEYIGRVYVETQKKPLYLIEKKL